MLYYWLIMNSRRRRSGYNSNYSYEGDFTWLAVIVTGLALALAGLIAWEATHPDKLVATEQVTVEVVGVHPGKFSTVDVKDTASGEIHRGVSVGMWMRDAEKQKGKVVTVTRQKWTNYDGSRTFYRILGMREHLYPLPAKTP